MRNRQCQVGLLNTDLQHAPEGSSEELQPEMKAQAARLGEQLNQK